MQTSENLGMQDAVMNTISEMAFFNHFEARELKEVAKHMSIREIERDEEVFKEGEKGNYMCFLAKGALNVIKDIDGEGVVLSKITTGKSFGEMAMVDLSPRSATIAGATASELLILGRQAFDQILEQHPKIGVKLLSGVARILSLHLRQASGRLADKLAT